MRLLVIGTLAALGMGAATVALADPPAGTTPPADKPAATATDSSATSTAAATAATKSTTLKDEFTPDENHFIQEGYHLEVHRNGERAFCRYEVSTESRVERHKICGTVDQLKASEAQSQRAFGAGQTQQSGH